MGELFDEQTAAQRRAQQRARRRRRIYLGLVLMAGGYASLAIAPDTPTHWLLPRVTIGFGLLFAGAGLVLGPLIERLLRDG